MGMTWIAAKVGCYWYGDNGFHIATRRTLKGASYENGYVLFGSGFRELGTYHTLHEAQAAAEPYWEPLPPMPTPKNQNGEEDDQHELG